MNKGPHDLIYFTHEVDGQRYGGWFRTLGESIEVIAQGAIRKQPLYGTCPENEARSILEEIVKARATNHSGRKHE